MLLSLEPARFTDGDAISYILAESFFSMRLQKRLFPNVPVETKLETQKSRWPRSYTDENTMYNKIVNDETGEVISVAKWAFANVDASDVLSDTSDLPGDCEIETETRSKGLDKDLYQVVEKAVESLLPKDLATRPHMSLAAIGTLSTYQGCGAGGMHMRWAAKVADEKGIPIYLEAAQEAAPFYARQGYTVIKTASISLEPQDEVPYIVTGMVREPK